MMFRQAILNEGIVMALTCDTSFFKFCTDDRRFEVTNSTETDDSKMMARVSFVQNSIRLIMLRSHVGIEVTI